ncbi:hypothetical protein [Bosea sp. (in: a-proteobacteria)]|nr:hypothetical protein [Bosea sp. (in: a-proteobacteria)]
MAESRSGEPEEAPKTKGKAEALPLKFVFYRSIGARLQQAQLIY